MKKSNKLLEQQLRESITAEVASYRSDVMDLVEQHLGTSKEWIIIRSRLLRHLGDRGLMGKINRILEREHVRGIYE